MYSTGLIAGIHLLHAAGWRGSVQPFPYAWEGGIGWVSCPSFPTPLEEEEGKEEEEIGRTWSIVSPVVTRCTVIRMLLDVHVLFLGTFALRMYPHVSPPPPPPSAGCVSVCV